jgi:hypothetical protein
MNMFRMYALAGTAAVCLLAFLAALLWILCGPMGLFIFLGTWPLPGFLAFVAGLVFVPEPR